MLHLLGSALGVLFMTATAQAQTLTALVGATLIDGTGSAPIADATVLIDGERIAAAGPRSAVTLPPGARVVDVRGRWIVPGLIDAHVHFFQSGGLYTRPDIVDLRAQRSYEQELTRIRQRMPQTLARYLASGVTGVVDVGGPLWNFEVRDLAGRQEHAPRVAVAGPLLSGYVPEALGSEDPAIVRVASPEEARAAVRAQLPHRPDLIKLWLVQSGQTRAQEKAWVRAAVEESHAAGVRVAAHATQLETARLAVQAGVDILVHSIEDRVVDEEFVALLTQRGVVYSTTLVVDEGYSRVLRGPLDLTDIERRAGDPEVIATWKQRIGMAPRRAWPGTQRFPDPIMAKNLRRLHAAGVTVAAGTDAGNIGTLHGPSLHRELLRMQQAGLPPMAVLQAATRGAAAVMGRDQELGTIEPGRIADLLVLDADPLADIRHTQQIHRVVKGGVILDPAQILSRLDENVPHLTGGTAP